MACERCHSTQWAVVLVGLVAAMVSGLSGVAADGESCLPLDADPTVTIGEPAYLCLRFNNNTQAVLTPIVDDFTQLSIENSNDFMPENTGFYDLSAQTWTPTMDDNTHEYVISVHPVVSNTAASFWKTYKKWAAGGASVKTVNVLTAIVLVDNGNVVDITWDDGCFFCDPGDADHCILDTFIQDPPSILQNSDYKACALDTTECSTANCDLNFYVVWSGTDSNGDYMRSAGMRFSRFRSFGVEGLYNSAKERVAQDAVTIAEAASKVESLANQGVQSA